LNIKNQKNTSSSKNQITSFPSVDTKDGKVLNIGVIGAGEFGEFAIKSFLNIKGVNIIAITDINLPAAKKLADRIQTIVFNNLNDFLSNEKIDLVYIATPPFLHYEQSKMALLAGKHVICEKPAALNLGEAKELVSLAASKQLLYVVNLMQRYNILYDLVNKIIGEYILGNFLHGFFENYASDEFLDANHWFWDISKSGGIFIEHGVHFFDMFSGWLGKGEMVNSLQIYREGFNHRIIDRVQATVMFKKGVVNFYHGFDQPKILDRQEIRLEFERGEITLYEWVPVKMKLHGLLTLDQINSLKKLLKDPKIEYGSEGQTENKKVRGRFKDIIFDKEITIEFGSKEDKQQRYKQLLELMITDQWEWIKDHNHKRKIDENNAVESLQMAEQATKMSRMF